MNPAQDLDKHRESELLKALAVELSIYHQGKVNFPGLVATLDVGISNLAAGEITESLRSQWRILEEVNALALNEGCEEPLRNHVELAVEAIQAMEATLKKARLPGDNP